MQDLGHIREAASEFRRRVESQGIVEDVRTLDVGTEPIAIRHAFGGAVRSLPMPTVTLVRRMAIVRFRDIEGASRVLCWRPCLPGLTDALARGGLTRADVDYVAFDHLQGQDMRMLAGTTQPVASEREPRLPTFPDATILCDAREIETFRSPHPMERAGYLPGGFDHVADERLGVLDGEAELGAGLALISTPGRTPGHRSLVVNTPSGIWVVSGNGVAADNWHPNLSKIPGVRREAESLGREVIASSVDQYDSMVKEKIIADPNRGDPRWKNVLPSNELPVWRRQWPVVSSFPYGGLQLDDVA